MSIERDKLRQTCKACGRPDKFNFNVPDWLWAAVVPENLINRVVCLYCFDEFAKQQGVDYAGHLRQLYFAGDRGCFRFEVGSAISVDD